MNLETICGGRICMLEENWLHLYAKERNPQDVIVVAGLNDIIPSVNGII